jgi:hypothetical protein
VAAGQSPLYAEVPARAAVNTEVRIDRRSARARSGGTWVVVAALAAGAVVTLYRNAVVHAAARSVGQEAAYLNLETALGGPSFGTPRAVEKMADSSRALLESIAAAPSAPVPAAVAPAATSESAAPAPVAAAKTEEPARPAALPAATSVKPAAASGATRPVSASMPRSPAASKEPAPVFKAPKKKSKGNEYDPLNPNL